MIRRHVNTERIAVYAPHSDEVRTKQSFAKEANINFIMSKYAKTGVFPSINSGTPLYSDNYDAVDLHEAYERVAEAEAQFMALPSEVRRLANNNPVELMAMLHEPEQLEALIEAGLEAEFLPPKPPERPVIPPNPDPAPGGETPTNT